MSVPERIGRYRLGPRLGAGGFATVWLAHDESLDTPIAIKVMAENWAHQLDVRERFLAEARMLRQARSARVVQVFDIGELPDGRPYFVMEYADRGTLADLTRHGTPPLPEALRLTAEVGRGVAELHRAGIVHRDLKPSNVLLRSSPDGPDRLLVADLGFAKTLAQATGLTMGGGSAGYMAPEQAAPGVGVDIRADVYSLGALGYHLATGQPPGAPGRVLDGDGNTARLPAGVRKVLARALAPERDRRWPDATSMVAALDRQRTRLLDRGRGRRARLLGVAAALVAVLLGSGLGVAAWLHRQGEPVTVLDSSGTLSLRVPRSWAGQLIGGGWDPATLGLPGGRAPGLIVADDARAWADLDVSVNGVFAGRSSDPGLPAAVAAIRHPGCRDEGQHQYTDQTWTGAVHQFSCAGRLLDEVSLTADSGAGVYLQLRRSGGQGSGAGAADTVLSSVHLVG